ncbi:MAG: hypothetical protein IBJ11_10030 [Phycisphaerales bacterium]|nr:hypothetical protein [Phycisphaerales bacterium]
MNKSPAIAAVWACVAAAAWAGAEPEKAPELHPAVRLGIRSIEASPRVHAGSVVIVPDGTALLGAMRALWTLEARAGRGLPPILIDDGSDGAFESIARFVRAFRPGTVLRWTPPADDDGGQPEWAGLVELLAGPAKERPGPGLVVVARGDPASAAGLVLAVARRQHLLILDAPPATRGVDGVMPAEELAALDRAIRGALSGTGQKWDGLGDDLDAITIAMNVPGRIPAPAWAGGELALTDTLGRDATGARYAYAGLLFGDEAAAVGRAMAAVFLTPPTRPTEAGDADEAAGSIGAARPGALLFDGYRPEFGAPFNLGPAAEALRKAGYRVTQHTRQPPTASAEMWLRRGRGGFDHSLVIVNTSGEPWWFDLNPGRCVSSDVPPNRVPSVVLFTHSFSAQRPGDVSTIAGRFLDPLAGGSFAYVGAVHEPYLSAFLPGPAAVGRLLAPMPLGAAVRHDPLGPQDRVPDEARRFFGPWKVQVLGDPLLTLPAAGPARPRRAAELPDNALPGLVNVADDARAALRASDLGAGLRGLVLAGRDGEALRLLRAIGRDNRKADDAAIAPCAVALLARTRDLTRDDADLFVRLFAALGTGRREHPVWRSMLWQTLGPTVGAMPGAAPDPGENPEADRRMVSLLMNHPRLDAPLADATLLAPRVARLLGPGALSAFLDRAAGLAGDDGIRAAIRALGGGLGLINMWRCRRSLRAGCTCGRRCGG